MKRPSNRLLHALGTFYLNHLWFCLSCEKKRLNINLNRQDQQPHPATAQLIQRRLSQYVPFRRKRKTWKPWMFPLLFGVGWLLLFEDHWFKPTLVNLHGKISVVAKQLQLHASDVSNVDNVQYKEEAY